MSVTQARRLRRSLSPPEATLWNVLRARPNGLKFRRQRPNDPYVFDFYCPTARLAIEVDGLAHNCGSNPERDAVRDRKVGARRIATLRIAAEDVRSNLEGVVTHIVDRCLERTPPPRSARSPYPAIAGEDA